MNPNPIEEKQLRTLIEANDNIDLTFQLLGDTEKNEFALITSIPGQSETKKFVLFTTLSKEVRRFKSLDRGVTFLQEIKPDIVDIRVEIKPMEEIPYIERRRKPRESD